MVWMILEGKGEQFFFPFNTRRINPPRLERESGYYSWTRQQNRWCVGAWLRCGVRPLRAACCAKTLFITCCHSNWWQHIKRPQGRWLWLWEEISFPLNRLKSFGRRLAFFQKGFERTLEQGSSWVKVSPKFRIMPQAQRHPTHSFGGSQGFLKEC